RRLVPALVLMVIVVTGLLRYLAPTSVASSARGQGLAAMLYVTNWKLIASSVSYGGAIGARSPFVHLWSLAVEEQFYPVWPVVVRARARAPRAAHGAACPSRPARARAGLVRRVPVALAGGHVADTRARRGQRADVVHAAARVHGRRHRDLVADHRAPAHDCA